VVPTISFTTNLRRHVDCPAATVGGTTVRAALDQYFAAQPQVRSYVLDEQGAVRRHVAVFVGRHQVLDPVSLSDPIDETTEIHVMQALSGG
jgi:sulfur-carrier protein